MDIRCLKSDLQNNTLFSLIERDEYNRFKNPSLPVAKAHKMNYTVKEKGTPLTTFTQVLEFMRTERSELKCDHGKPLP
ncbi:hypothetical protein [Aestuariivivens sediminicola]|uniref:hypothetical protein n=1 Tax=Aestuariivivens sediminicola TaxID=2913560 RepID=UPI001F5A651F|nr:hypothetical protein [Aestuariivivens sediminicola]